MFCPRPTYRSPSVAPEPIRTAADARSLIATAITHPLRDETVAFLLDDAGYGSTIIIVAGTDRPDQLLDVVEHLAVAGGCSGTFTSLVVASVRPGGGLEPGDVDRWFDASDLAEEHGVELLEWFVYDGYRFERPRELIGERERWPG
jgi:hypothetical protein